MKQRSEINITDNSSEYSDKDKYEETTSEYEDESIMKPYPHINAGLQNLYNTYYINAAIQAFLSFHF